MVFFSRAPDLGEAYHIEAFQKRPYFGISRILIIIIIMLRITAVPMYANDEFCSFMQAKYAYETSSCSRSWPASSLQIYCCMILLNMLFILLNMLEMPVQQQLLLYTL